ncbi:hypothetical protein DM828_05320 [Pseudomonas umsongensis]|nr:hypothetical protein [Pseudomonas umsongensis]
MVILMRKRFSRDPGKTDNAIFVGASLLAMEVNDDARSLTPRGAIRFFASRLAPTGNASYIFPGNA